MQVLLTPVGSSPVAVTPITPACLFSYAPPVITGIAVVRARFTNASAPQNSTSGGAKDTLAVPCPFPPGDPFWSCELVTNASLLMIVIQVRTLRGFKRLELLPIPAASPSLQGYSFDTSPVGALGPDGVTRGLSMLSGSTWQAAGGPLVFVDYAQWTSTRVVGYTLQSSGTVNISLSSTGYYGPTEVSASASYVQVSPYIAALAGSSAEYNTTGGGLLILKGKRGLRGTHDGPGFTFPALLFRVQRPTLRARRALV